MAKIDELLNELRNEAVELKKLGDICNVIRGRRLTTRELKETGDFPVFHGGLEPIGFYTNSNREPNSAMIINVGASAGTVNFYSDRFWSSDGCFCFSHNDSTINQLFLFYALKNNENSIKSKVRRAGIPTLDNKDIERLNILVPTLQVQQKIVEILDTFTDAISNLEEELALREKQFEYYREQLLSFDDEDIDKAELSSISDIKGRIGFRGYTRNDIVDKGAGAISLSPSNIVDGMLHFENSTYISWEKYEESPEIKASEGQIVLTKTGSTVGKVALIKHLPEPCTINPQLVLITCTTFNSAYLNYVLQSFSMQSEIKRLAGIGAVPNISQKLLGKIIVPIPSSDRQQEIVEILDTFEAMIANIKEEIALRTKQYEYYREKLLSFGK